MGGLGFGGMYYPQSETLVIWKYSHGRQALGALSPAANADYAQLRFALTVTVYRYRDLSKPDGLEILSGFAQDRIPWSCKFLVVGRKSM